jgi:hypothetical protein
MTREQVENVDPRIETLARMWIECDPNRGGDEPGSGFHPDDMSLLHVDGAPKEEPRWKWFIPRAEASLHYLQERGLIA